MDLNVLFFIKYIIRKHVLLRNTWKHPDIIETQTEKLGNKLLQHLDAAYTQILMTLAKWDFQDIRN